MNKAIKPKSDARTVLQLMSEMARIEILINFQIILIFARPPHEPFLHPSNN